MTDPTAFKIIPLGPALGAEIRGLDLSTPLPDATVDALRRAWVTHQVLVFRDQTLSDDALSAFSRRFGDLDTVPGWEPFSPEGHPEVLIISNVQEDGTAIGVLGDGEASWHTDMSYLDQPPPGSLLYSLEVPADGGDTCFMSMHAALDALPPKMLALSSTAIVPVDLDAEALETRVDEVTARIGAATFTGKGDKEAVVKMLKDYNSLLAFSRSTRMLQRARKDSDNPHQKTKPVVVPVDSLHA